MTWTTTKKQLPIPVICGMLAFNTCPNADELLYFDVEKPLDYENDVRNLSGDHWLTINTVIDHIGISDVIKQIKVGLGLPNKDIAKVFGVTRQTVYNYLNQSNINNTINSNTHKRALLLQVVAENFSGIFEKSPGAMAKNFTIDGQSLFDLLSEEHLNIDKISTFAVKLSERMSQYSSSSGSVNNITLMDLTRHS